MELFSIRIQRTFQLVSTPLPQATKMTPDAVLDGGMETEAYA